MFTREQITIRSLQLTEADYKGIAALYCASNEADGIDQRPTAAAFKNYFTAPDIHPELMSVVEEDGQIVAYSEIETSDETGVCWQDIIVHPAYRGRGIGAALLERAEAQLLEVADIYIPQSLPILARRSVPAANARANRLLVRHGYRHNRTFYEMRIDLSEPHTVSPLPDGIRFEPFDRAKQGYALYEAHEEAFSQHWGFERDTWEEFAHYVYDRPGVDFSMWLIAWEGDEIAGYSLNRQLADEDPTFAWVGILGVRPGWRKRGLGAALLNHSFALFQSRGYTRAGLVVDAENTTNALALYERVGMYVHRSTNAYEKKLRETALS